MDFLHSCSTGRNEQRQITSWPLRLKPLIRLSGHHPLWSSLTIIMFSTIEWLTNAINHYIIIHNDYPLSTINLPPFSIKWSTTNQPFTRLTIAINNYELHDLKPWLSTTVFNIDHCYSPPISTPWKTPKHRWWSRSRWWWRWGNIRGQCLKRWDAWHAHGAGVVSTISDQEITNG